MAAATLGACARLPNTPTVALANGLVVQASIAVLDDDTATAQALYEQAAALFRHAGDLTEALRIEAFAADVADAPALPVAA